MSKKKKYEIVRTPQFEEDMKRLSPEEREAVEETIEEISKDPYKGEPTRPCPKCGEYFWHSDGECPFCGFILKVQELEENR